MTTKKHLLTAAGGERKHLEIADFPKQKKRMLRVGGRSDLTSFDALTLLWRSPNEDG